MKRYRAPLDHEGMSMATATKTKGSSAAVKTSETKKALGSAARVSAALKVAAAEGQPASRTDGPALKALLAREDAQAERTRKARKSRGWGATTVRMGTGCSVPKVIILGRGQLTGRKLFATRLPQDVMDRLRGLVSGPDYLALQLAVTAYCDDLESREDTQVIPAENLG